MARIAFRQDLNAGTTIWQDPVANKTGRERLNGHRLWIEAAAKSREVILERRNDGSFSLTRVTASESEIRIKRSETRRAASALDPGT